MIIGINGYAGSGKDTIGKLIQLLHCENLSKDIYIQEVFDNYEQHEWWIEEQSGWEIKKWAGKLKTIASLLTGIPVEKFEDQKFKKTTLGPEWTTWATNDGNPPKDGTAVIGKLMTVRDFLQKLGTDACRNGLHTNTWVNALMADYKPQPNRAVADFLAAEGLPQSMNAGKEEYPNWIITDTRFPNEAQAIKDAGGIVIRVDRPGVKPVNPHPSETALDNWDFDYKIMNGSDLVALMFTVNTILKKINHG